MDIAQLRTFVAAAQTGSFVAAAGVVHASPSSVTERIATLESRLGARLFDRSRRGCALTVAGKRFLPRAQAMLSAWNIARQTARIPPRFTGHARIGGQFSLWSGFIIEWAEGLRVDMPSLALSLTASSAVRLNRELAEDLLDLAILYSPLIGPALNSRVIAHDRLVLVRSAGLDNWRDGWVDINWGDDVGEEISRIVAIEDGAGIRLDFGGLAVEWIESCGASGYVPERLAQDALARGTIVRVADMPDLDFPIHAVWPRSRSDLVEPLLASLTTFIAGLPFAFSEA